MKELYISNPSQEDHYFNQVGIRNFQVINLETPNLSKERTKNENERNGSNAQNKSDLEDIISGMRIGTV